jgi:hypothetical protein
MPTTAANDPFFNFFCSTRKSMTPPSNRFAHNGSRLSHTTAPVSFLSVLIAFCSFFFHLPKAFVTTINQRERYKPLIYNSHFYFSFRIDALPRRALPRRVDWSLLSTRCFVPCLVLCSQLPCRSVGLYVENDPTTRRFPRIPWYPDHFLHASL